MNLRAELAERFARMFAMDGHLGGLSGWDNVPVITNIPEGFPTVTYGHLADEAIRQMRWARHSAKWNNPETTPWITEQPSDYLNQEDVTLAPENWEAKPWPLEAQMKDATAQSLKAVIETEQPASPALTDSIKAEAALRFRIDPTNKDDFDKGHRVIREIGTMTPVCMAYGKDAAEAILALLNNKARGEA